MFPLSTRPRKSRPGLTFSIGEIFYALFFQPQSLLVLQEDRWNRAFRYMAVLSLAGGVIVAAARIPDLLQITDSFAQRLELEVKTLSLADGVLE